MKCKKHPKYKAIRPPRATDKNPQGCRDCWRQYEMKHEGRCEEEEEVSGQ